MKQDRNLIQANVLTPAEFAALGTGEVAYLKSMTSDELMRIFPQAPKIESGLQLFTLLSADGAPIAAGFMAWSQCFFPWTLDYDEIDLVLEGELHIRCNGQTFVGKAGEGGGLVGLGARAAGAEGGSFSAHFLKSSNEFLLNLGCQGVNLGRCVTVRIVLHDSSAGRCCAGVAHALRDA